MLWLFLTMLYRISQKTRSAFRYQVIIALLGRWQSVYALPRYGCLCSDGNPHRFAYYAYRFRYAHSSRTCCRVWCMCAFYEPWHISNLHIINSTRWRTVYANDTVVSRIIHPGCVYTLSNRNRHRFDASKCWILCLRNIKCIPVLDEKRTWSCATRRTRVHATNTQSTIRIPYTNFRNAAHHAWHGNVRSCSGAVMHTLAMHFISAIKQRKRRRSVKHTQNFELCRLICMLVLLVHICTRVQFKFQSKCCIFNTLSHKTWCGIYSVIYIINSTRILLSPTETQFVNMLLLWHMRPHRIRVDGSRSGMRWFHIHKTPSNMVFAIAARHVRTVLQYATVPDTTSKSLRYVIMSVCVRVYACVDIIDVIVYSHHSIKLKRSEARTVLKTAPFHFNCLVNFI